MFQRLKLKVKIKNEFFLLFLVLWLSFLVLFLTQMFDVQYFDGRISVMFWLLAAGLIQVISEKKT